MQSYSELSNEFYKIGFDSLDSTSSGSEFTYRQKGPAASLTIRNETTLGFGRCECDKKSGKPARRCQSFPLPLHLDLLCL